MHILLLVLALATRLSATLMGDLCVQIAGAPGAATGPCAQLACLAGLSGAPPARTQTACRRIAAANLSYAVALAACTALLPASPPPSAAASCWASGSTSAEPTVAGPTAAEPTTTIAAECSGGFRFVEELSLEVTLNGTVMLSGTVRVYRSGDVIMVYPTTAPFIPVFTSGSCRCHFANHTFNATITRTCSIYTTCASGEVTAAYAGDYTIAWPPRYAPSTPIPADSWKFGATAAYIGSNFAEKLCNVYYSACKYGDFCYNTMPVRQI